MAPLSAAAEPSVLRHFAGDHVRIDHSLQLFCERNAARDPGAAALFEAVRHDLERHLLCEEEVLFATLESRAGGRHGSIAVMHAEHGRIRDALDRLGSALRAGSADLEELEAELIELLQTHNFKEERVLYPIVDRVLSVEERRSLLAALDGLPTDGTPRCCA